MRHPGTDSSSSSQVNNERDTPILSQPRCHAGTPITINFSRNHHSTPCLSSCQNGRDFTSSSILLFPPPRQCGGPSPSIASKWEGRRRSGQDEESDPGNEGSHASRSMKHDLPHWPHLIFETVGCGVVFVVYLGEHGDVAWPGVEKVIFLSIYLSLVPNVIVNFHYLRPPGSCSMMRRGKVSSAPAAPPAALSPFSVSTLTCVGFLVRTPCVRGAGWLVS